MFSPFSAYSAGLKVRNTARSKPHAEATLRCQLCSTMKPVSEFIGSNVGARVCRPCKSSVNRWNRFGLAPWDYEWLLEKQSNACAICRVDLDVLDSKHVVIDHCHTTGAIRGVLCRKCNTAIGYLNDDADTVAQAASYLRQESGIPRQPFKDGWSGTRRWHQTLLEKKEHGVD